MRAKAREEPRGPDRIYTVPEVSSGVGGRNASVLGYSNLVIDQRIKPVHPELLPALYPDLDRRGFI